ncbi:MAG: class II aldolase/adducin family protein [Armatimonadetes bacterium]|nr:class II aldolase/adducin family protein [Armatimonadota bacterium]
MSILDRLVLMTRELARHEFVILGEGNTSALDGETFWVKASGASMASIDADGFSQVSMQPVLDIYDLYDLSDEELRRRLNDARVAPERDGAPSTETFMHAWLLSLPDVCFVAHTHPTATLGVMCGPRAAEFAAHRYFPDQVVMCGPRSVFVEYVAPGLRLAQAIRSRCSEYTSEIGLQAKTILLQNHGLIALGQTPGEALSATMMMEKAASVFVAADDPVALSAEEVAWIHGWTDEQFRQGKIWGD